MYNTIYNNWLFSADNSQISLDSLSKCLKLVNLSIFFCRWEKMFRANYARKRVASAVARECAEMSRASVESSNNKKRTRRETTAIHDEANPSGWGQADVTVEASVGEVFDTEDQGSSHESAFVPSNSVDAAHSNHGAPKPVDSIENSVGFGISLQG